MVNKAKYKRLPDLYTEGTEIPLANDAVIWMQVLNPYERDEAIHDAQVARSRVVMAMRENGSERVKIEAKFDEVGRDGIQDEIAMIKAGAKVPEFVNELQDDPEWHERLEILERTEAEQAATPLSEEEQSLLLKIHTDYIGEIIQRENDERDYVLRQLKRMEDSQVLDEYLDLWLDKRGAEVANAEFLLTEMWYGARACDATRESDGSYDHSRCDSHAERIWDSKAEVRSLPEALQSLLRDAVRDLQMSVREAKNSDRQGSSSDSSPLPSEAAESTPSTRTGTPVGAPGT